MWRHPAVRAQAIADQLMVQVRRSQIDKTEIGTFSFSRRVK